MAASKTPPEAPYECALCPRLLAYHEENRRDEPDWHNGPVDSFGDKNAELLIVGLAPGRGGANKTGRPFTGDWAGDLLYATLEKFELSNGKYSAHANDRLELRRAMITNAVRCVPPQNKPIGEEINNCRPFLISRIEHLPNLKAILALGKIAHDSVVRALGVKLKDAPFGHGARIDIAHNERSIRLFDSYHCSRYNTNTRRLTTDMFEDVFADIKNHLS